MTTSAVVVGNLDCEWRWAHERAQAAGRRFRPLPAPVLVRISLFATLLRVFAEEGDALWTPRPVDETCMRPVPELTEPRLISGNPPKPAEAVRLAWAGSGGSMARLNDRAYAHDLAVELGYADPDAMVIARVEDVERHLPRERAWILKAPLSAAGRDRVRGEGRALSDETRARIARMFAEHGSALLQSWVNRTADVGFGAEAAPHGIEVDAAGGFRGIVIPGPALTAAEETQVARVRRAVAAAVDRAGYAGPWCVDAWRYVDTSGQERFQPLGELNARLTFGLVARALHERVATSRWGADTNMALRFGDRPEPAGQDDVVPLVGAAEQPRMYAWLERRSSRSGNS